MSRIIIFVTILFIFSSCSIKQKITILREDNSLSIYHKIAKLKGGDTLFFEEGIYDLELFANIPSGKNWRKPVVLFGIGKSKPVFKPSKGNVVIHFGLHHITQLPVHHIEIIGFVLDGVNVNYDVIKITEGANHIRIKDCIIMNAKNQGVLIAHNDSNYNEILHCKIHNNGITDFEHGLYITSNHNLVQDCEIYNNAGAGINIYDGKGFANYNQVINCHIHNNAAAGNRGAGIGIHTGKGNIAKNNIIHDNASGIHTDYGASNTLIQNNVLYGHSYFDLIIGDGCSNCEAKNNSILWKENKTETLISKNAVAPKVSKLTIRNTKEEILLDVKAVKKISNE
jgi:hypothetical protein